MAAPGLTLVLWGLLVEPSWASDYKAFDGGGERGGRVFDKGVEAGEERGRRGKARGVGEGGERGRRSIDRGVEDYLTRFGYLPQSDLEVFQIKNILKTKG